MRVALGTAAYTCVCAHACVCICVRAHPRPSTPVRQAAEWADQGRRLTVGGLRTPVQLGGAPTGWGRDGNGLQSELQEGSPLPSWWAVSTATGGFCRVRRGSQ